MLTPWSRRLLPTAFAGPRQVASFDTEVDFSPSQRAVVDGTIKKVQYRSSQSGYSVLKVGVSRESLSGENLIPEGALEGSALVGQYTRRKNKKGELSITVVGILPVLHVGQGVTVEGNWTTHPTYGVQLKASHVETRTPSGQKDLISFLSSGAIHGVGPSTATRMVDTWGSDVLDVLDSEDAAVKLAMCDGIGANKAIAIKTAWDSGRDARDAANFLCERGIPAGAAQRVAEAYGAETRERVVSDPYAALSRFSISLDLIEAFAVKTEASVSDLLSRMSLVITRCLLASSNRDGHAYLEWRDLEALVLKRLEDLSRKYGGEGGHIAREHLELVALHMAQKGTLVCESGAIRDGAAPYSPLPERPAVSRNEMRDILSCISNRQFESLVGVHGGGLSAVLDGEPDKAAELLLTCPGIGPKTVEKILNAWNKGENGPTNAFSLGGATRVHELVGARNLEAPCQWSESVRCYLPHFHKAETAIVRCVEEKAKLPKDMDPNRLRKIQQWVSTNQETTNVVLSKGQRAAIEMASDAPILVITGGPGCGKTTVLQYIVKLWCAQGKMVNICAPTGRAAQRIGAIQHVEPSTIHRLLKYRPKTSSNENESSQSIDEEEIDMGEMDWFEHGPSNKLESDAVLVDEASMLSLPLAAALMQSLHTNTQLILVGDVDQLPPVGPGGVLDAMISSGVVPVIDLREIFRQEMTSSIVTSALSVRGGMYPVIDTVLDSEEGVSDATRTPGAAILRTHEDSIVDPIERVVRGFLDREDVDIGDIQVISPMRKGPVGVAHLNPRIQAIVNPPELGKLEVSRGDLVLRMGDRVLQLFNDYDKDVYNGDQGTIVDVDPVLKKVWVLFSKGFGGDGQLIEYSGMELSHLDLAYAVTVHKAQGGEAKNVILILSQQHGRLLTRPLLYTGITRARENLVMVVGSSHGDPMATAIQTVGMETRKSSLVERFVSKATSQNLGVS
jgi:RecD/TraA family predicted helicase